MTFFPSNISISGSYIRGKPSCLWYLPINLDGLRAVEESDLRTVTSNPRLKADKQIKWTPVHAAVVFMWTFVWWEIIWVDIHNAIFSCSITLRHVDFGTRSRYLGQFNVGCNCLWLPKISFSGTKFLIYEGYPIGYYCACTCPIT